MKKRDKARLAKHIAAASDTSIVPGVTVRQLTCPHMHCSALPDEYLMAICNDCGAKVKIQAKKREDR